MSINQQNEYNMSQHIWILFYHMKKNVYFIKNMDEGRAMNEMEVNLLQEKIEFINDVHQKELHYWTKAALERVLTKKGRNQ